MKLQQLRYIWEVSRHNLNVSATAQSLYTSQPGISKQIRLLEDELGVEIFARSGKHLTRVTPAGEAIIELAGQVLRLTDNIKHVSQEHSDERRGSMAIATTHTQARYALPPVIREFTSRYPDVALHMQQGTPRQIARWSVTARLISRSAPSRWICSTIWCCCPAIAGTVAYWCPGPSAGGSRATDPGGPGRASAGDLCVRFHRAFATRRCLPGQGTLAQCGADRRRFGRDQDLCAPGHGGGIVAHMAFDPDQDDDLVALDASHLFASSTTKIGIRRGTFMRGYMYDFLKASPGIWSASWWKLPWRPGLAMRRRCSGISSCR